MAAGQTQRRQDPDPVHLSDPDPTTTLRLLISHKNANLVLVGGQK